MKDLLKGTNSKICLIGKIKGLANESKLTRLRLLKAKTDEKVCKFAYTKYIIGLDIRHHLLAYAFLKGKLYSELEKKCRPEHKPNPETLLIIAHSHFPQYAKGFLLENIKNWLDGKEV